MKKLTVAWISALSAGLGYLSGTRGLEGAMRRLKEMEEQTRREGGFHSEVFFVHLRELFEPERYTITGRWLSGHQGYSIEVGGD